MLKQRVTTALLAAVAMIAAVMGLSSTLLAALVFVIVILGVWEWSSLTGLSQPIPRLLFFVFFGVVALVAWLMLRRGQQLPVIAVGGMWWIVVVVILATYRPDSLAQNWTRVGLRLAVVFTLIPAWIALIDLHDMQPTLLLFLLFLIWIADTAAYFTGKRLGKTKLAPHLSPGKTREGLLGALLATGVFGFLGAVWLGLPLVLNVYFIGLCLVTTLISVAGDLFESLLKRRAGVKDSGALLPGHGGVMDRIDSVSAATPVFALGVHWMNWSDRLSG